MDFEPSHQTDPCVVVADLCLQVLGQKHLYNLLGLTNSNFEIDRPTRRESSSLPDLRDQRTNDLQTILAPVESQPWLMHPNVGHETGDIAGRYVGQVSGNHIPWALLGDRIEQIPVGKPNVETETLGIALRHLQRVG